MKILLVISILILGSSMTYGQHVKNKKIIKDKPNKEAESLIVKYQTMLINNEEPHDEKIQTKYEKEYRAIVIPEILSNASKYSQEKIEMLGYEYIGVSVNDNQHYTLQYRSCKDSTILELTEWYDVKLVLTLQWYSDNVKKRIGYLMFCR